MPLLCFNAFLRTQAGLPSSVLSDEWLQIYMVENEYDMDEVTNIANYSIVSADDPDFSLPVRPELVHHRYFAEYATYKDYHGSSSVSCTRASGSDCQCLPSSWKQCWKQSLSVPEHSSPESFR